MEEEEDHHGAALLRQLAHNGGDVVGEDAGKEGKEERFVDVPELVDETSCSMAIRTSRESQFPENFGKRIVAGIAANFCE